MTLPRSLAQAIRALGPSDPEHGQLVEQLFDYLSSVLAPERQLWGCCPHGADCWRAGVERPPVMHFRVPYVGPAYPSRRILLIAMNARDDGVVENEFRDVARVAERFRSGNSDWGGQFQFKAAVAVSILAAAQDGEVPITLPTKPGMVVDPWLASAKLQAVQCAPGPITSRRSPTAQMWRNCPALLLARQVEILRPRVVALLGVATHRAVQGLPDLGVNWDTSWRENESCFARGTILSGGGQVPLFALNHPSAYRGRWQASVEKLVESLGAEPLA